MKPQIPMLKLQQNPKSQRHNMWDFAHGDFIGHWSSVIGTLKNTKYNIQHTTYKTRGFTLVEMIVALGMFTTVMLVVVSVLASVAGANEKGRTLRIVIDNLNFAVENMARTLRVGSQYHCGDSGLPDYPNCPSGESLIIFSNFQDGATTGFRLNADVNGIGMIERSDKCNSSDVIFSEGDCNPDGNNWKRITAPEIDVKSLKFYVVGAEESDIAQAQVFLLTSGTAGKGAVQTDFNIQTTVTQRLADS